MSQVTFASPPTIWEIIDQMKTLNINPYILNDKGEAVLSPKTFNPTRGGGKAEESCNHFDYIGTQYYACHTGGGGETKIAQMPASCLVPDEQINVRKNSGGILECIN